VSKCYACNGLRPSDLSAIAMIGCPHRLIFGHVAQSANCVCEMTFDVDVLCSGSSGPCLGEVRRSRPKFKVSGAKCWKYCHSRPKQEVKLRKTSADNAEIASADLNLKM